MKRKRVFSTCGCVLAMGMAISAVSVQAAVYSSIQSSVTKPQAQAGDGLFDYCSDEVKEFAKNFNKDEVFSLAYRQDGETRIDVATFDADEIQAFFDAMSSIKVKNVTTERSSDCDDIFYFTFADASAYRISFNGHHLEANGLCYEISGDEKLWKLANALLKNGDDEDDQIDNLETKNQDDTDNSGVINSKNGNEGTKNPGIGGIVGNIGNDAKTSNTNGDSADLADPDAVVSYTLTSIVDQETNETVARCYAPSDYTIEHQIMWWGDGKWQSPASPVQVQIQASSADMMYQMAYMSNVVYTYSESFAQNGWYEPGSLYYNTYVMLTPMYASGYADFIISSLVTDTDITIEAEEEVTAEQEEELNQLAQQAYDYYNSDDNGLVNLDGVACTASDRTYSFQLDGIDYRAKVVTMTCINQFTSKPEAGFSDTYYTWSAPYTYVYMTPTDVFEKGLDSFDLFLLNTKVSDGFMIAANNLSTQLIAQISNGTQSAQTPGDYFKSELEKQPDTYDAESFCDYILSQNAYETADGSTIKLPNIYDYVYEGDDGKIYAGNTADQPAGSTRLYAK